MAHEREIEFAIRERRKRERLPRDVEARKRVMRDIALGRLNLGGAQTQAPAEMPVLQRRGLTGQFGGAVSTRPAQPTPTATAPAPPAVSPQFRRAVTSLGAPIQAAPAPTGIQAKTTEEPTLAGGPRTGTPQPVQPTEPIDTSGTLARRRELFREATEEPHLRPQFGEAAERLRGEEEIEQLLNQFARSQMEQIQDAERAALTELMGAAARAGALGGEGAGVSGDVFGLASNIHEARARAEAQVEGNLALIRAQFEHDIDLAELQADLQSQLAQMQEPGFFESLVNVGLGVAGVVSLFKDGGAAEPRKQITDQAPSAVPAESTFVPTTKTGQAVQEFTREIGPVGATAPATGAPIAFRESLDRLGRGLQATGAMDLPAENPESFWNPTIRSAVASGVAQAATPTALGQSPVQEEDWKRLRQLGLAEWVFGADKDGAWFVIDDPRLIAIAPPGALGATYRLSVNGPAKQVYQQSGGKISPLIDQGILEVRRWMDGSIVDLIGGR